MAKVRNWIWIGTIFNGFIAVFGALIAAGVCPDIGSQRRYGAHPYPYAGSGSGLLSPGTFYRADGRSCFCAFPHLLFFRESFFKKASEPALQQGQS